MLDVALAVTVTGLIFVLLGAPLAATLRRRDEGWGALLSDSAALGVVFLTLAITAWDWLGLAGLIAAALLWGAAIAASLRLGTGLPAVRLTLRPLPLTIVAVAIAITAILLRLHDAPFLPWVGDMGAYVNWANEFVRTGELHAAWPPIFSSFLAVSTAIFGPAGTTSGVALTGLLLIAVIVRVLRQLSVNRWVVLFITGALALSIHGIWFSSFPSSESLNAPLFALWLSLFLTLLRTDARQVPATVGAVFLTMLSLCLLRGSGTFLLVPVVALAAISLAVPAWRAWSPRILLFFTGSLIGACLGVWYGVSEIPRYFIDMQLGFLLPEALLRWGKESTLLAASPLMVTILVAMIVVALAGWRLAVRLSVTSSNRGTTLTRVLAAVAALALVGGVAIEGLVGANAWYILLRMGMWLVLAAAAALVVLSLRRALDERVPLAFLAVATTLMLIAFHTQRLGGDRHHAFFIYWDRYLVSEVMPALLIMAGLGIHLVLESLAKRRGADAPPPNAVIAAVITVLAIAATAVPHISTLQTISRGGYMAGAYDFVTELRSHSEPGDVLLWGATSADAAPGFFFPNTWMAFAVPMERSFGYDFLNVSQGNHNFSPDDVLTAAELETVLDGSDSVIVYETVTERGLPLSQRLADADLTITELGRETSSIQLLSQAPTPTEWTTARITVVIWQVAR